VENVAITVIPTSCRTANTNYIILSKGTYTRVLFKPILVENPKNCEQSIKGSLTITKTKKEFGDFDSDKITRKKIEFGQEVDISLDTEETYNLYIGLENLYNFKKTNPIPTGPNVYRKVDGQLEQLQNLLRDNENFAGLLKNIKMPYIDLLNMATNIEKLIRIKNELNDNMDNDNEFFWQQFLMQNTFVLSQIFVLPMIIYKEQVYVGGKGFDNCGGKYIDFLYENINTHNAAIIEIKTPVSNLMNPIGRYRDNISTAHSNLTDAICQIYTQSDSFVKNYNILKASSQEQKDIRANNIEAILLIGKIENLDEIQKDCFELFRNDLKRVRIICFDELQKRIEILLEMLQSEPSQYNKEYGNL
jgi:hypothetical protein